jgi:hypothetical protein
MSEYIEVQGFSDLAREVNSNAIINTNLVAYNSYLKKSKEANMQKKDLRDAIRDINILKNEMQEIKKLLINLSESKKHGSS